MGLFDFLKKKTNNRANFGAEICTTRSSMDHEMNDELFRKITHDVAVFMNAANITTDPMLKFLKDDKGLLDGMVFGATVAPAYTSIKRQNPEQYLLITGMHAFGYGIYVTGSQSRLGKSITEYTNDDVLDITSAKTHVDAYELGLRTLGVDPSSNNKQVLDQIIVTAMHSLKNNSTVPLDDTNIRTYMQVLFNAGVTIFYRK
jgi:hypothetical protein